jgi:hypothetical protein
LIHRLRISDSSAIFSSASTEVLYLEISSDVVRVAATSVNGDGSALVAAAIVVPLPSPPTLFQRSCQVCPGLLGGP